MAMFRENQVVEEIALLKEIQKITSEYKYRRNWKKMVEKHGKIIKWYINGKIYISNK